MMTDCDIIDTCAFLKKYENIAASTIKKMIEMYCTGDNSGNCLRKKYTEKKGEDPEDSMMPNGVDAESGQKIKF